MKARVGDTLLVKGHTATEPDQAAEILEVHGEGGAPPYLVRWDFDGHVGLIFPGSDAEVRELAHLGPAGQRT